MRLSGIDDITLLQVGKAIINLTLIMRENAEVNMVQKN
jgi:hypothetical protein